MRQACKAEKGLKEDTVRARSSVRTMLQSAGDMRGSGTECDTRGGEIWRHWRNVRDVKTAGTGYWPRR
jgi:hypothetical protein